MVAIPNLAGVLFATAATAHPFFSHNEAAPLPPNTNWDASFQKPGPNDVRSPCPGLNVLANHGFINRNGKGLTYQAIGAAAKQVYNFEAKPFENVAKFAIRMLANVTSLPGTIDLSALRQHDVIEHDASLSRDDIKQGNNWIVNPALVEQMLTLTPGDSLTYQDFGFIRAIRNTQSQNLGSPALTGRLLFGSNLESTLVMNVHGKENTTGTLVAPKASVRTWFLEERIPTGYVPQSREIGNLQFLAGATIVDSATNKVRLSNAPPSSKNNPNAPASLPNPLSVLAKPFEIAAIPLKGAADVLAAPFKAAGDLLSGSSKPATGAAPKPVPIAAGSQPPTARLVVDMEKLAKGLYHEFTESDYADVSKMRGIMAMHGLPVRF